MGKSVGTRTESYIEVILPDIRDITIVAAVILPDITAREDAMTVIGKFCVAVLLMLFGGVDAGVGYASPDKLGAMSRRARAQEPFKEGYFHHRELRNNLDL